MHCSHFAVYSTFFLDSKAFLGGVTGLRNAEFSLFGLLPLLPVPRLDDFRAARKSVHNVHPASVHAAIGERGLDELPVVEPGVAFEVVHALPLLERDFDQFCMDDRVSDLLEGGGAPAGVVERPHDLQGVMPTAFAQNRWLPSPVMSVRSEVTIIYPARGPLSRMIPEICGN